MPTTIMPEPFVSATSFIDRRSNLQSDSQPVRERRQFTNSHSELSPEARQLAEAIDQYKLHHRRRYITCEEMLAVIKSLGYRLDSPDME